MNTILSKKELKILVDRTNSLQDHLPNDELDALNAKLKNYLENKKYSDRDLPTVEFEIQNGELLFICEVLYEAAEKYEVNYPRRLQILKRIKHIEKFIKPIRERKDDVN